MVRERTATRFVFGGTRRSSPCESLSNGEQVEIDGISVRTVVRNASWRYGIPDACYWG